MSKTIKRPTFTIKEVAEFLGIHERTVLGYVRDNKIIAVRIGRRWEIHQECLDDFLKGKNNKEDKNV